MKIFFSIFLICFVNSLVKAQSPESIVSDRPGNAYTSTTVGKGVFQGQDGLEFSRSTSRKVGINDRLGNIISHSYVFTNYYRFGLGSTNELNLILDYRNTDVNRQNLGGLSGNEGDLNGLSKIALGFRQNLVEEKGNTPSLGILVHANFNGLLNDYREANPEGFVLILAQKQLTNVFSFTTNLGFNVGDIFKREELANSGLYTFNVGYGISPKLSGYVEAYGLISDGRVIDYYDTGFGYLLNPDIQLDLYAGINSEENYFEYFVSAGVSVRFGAK